MSSLAFCSKATTIGRSKDTTQPLPFIMTLPSSERLQMIIHPAHSITAPANPIKRGILHFDGGFHKHSGPHIVPSQTESRKSPSSPSPPPSKPQKPPLPASQSLSPLPPPPLPPPPPASPSLTSQPTSPPSVVMSPGTSSRTLQSSGTLQTGSMNSTTNPAPSTTSTPSTSSSSIPIAINSTTSSMVVPGTDGSHPVPPSQSANSPSSGVGEARGHLINTGAIVGISVGAVALIIGILVFFFFWHQRTLRKGTFGAPSKLALSSHSVEPNQDSLSTPLGRDISTVGRLEAGVLKPHRSSLYSVCTLPEYSRYGPSPTYPNTAGAQ
ncbi:hypothetical protein BDZ94DRAFT_1301710 [Collybia nuda]|uniref:Uncharacterized protein n=1 Tax=Collybia nuda TaxID=64659 RepID=A0A9P5XXX1_9AGAR|nr:hypothetical protein BDZ94DRAFT_1301710 [Collybia nuda]